MPAQGAAYYHRDGDWYTRATAFPAAYFDDHGYVLFRSRADYEGSPYLQLGVQVAVPGGIATIPGYRRMR